MTPESTPRDDLYDDVLVPTDGSEGAQRGIEHGVDIAAKYDATVHALYVVDEHVYGETPALSSMELAFEQAEQAGREEAQEVAERAEKRGLETRTAVTRGEPYRCITEYAEDHDVDLIVMGLHGTGQHGSPHIGSVTDRVLRTTDVPVFPV